MDIVSAYPFLIAGIACLALAIRVAVRRSCPEAIGPDTFLHLHMAGEIRSSGHIPEHMGRTEYSTAYTYPMGYHWLLARVPARLVRPVEAATGALCDMAQVLWFGIVARVLFEGWGHDPQSAALAGLATACLICFAPAFLSIHGGPRAYMGSARPLGQLLFAVFAGSTLLWQATDTGLWIIPAALAVALASITSKFSNQAVTFISVFACLFGEWHLLVAGLLGFATAAAVFNRHFFRTIRGQIGHTVFYVRHLQAPYLDRALDTGPGHGARMRTAVASARAYGMRYLVDWLFSDPNLAHKLVVLHFTGLAGIALLVAGTVEDAPVPDIVWSLAAIFLASCIAAAATQTRRFRYLGESYRYVEHTVGLQAMLVAGLLIDTHPLGLGAVLGISAFLGVMALFQAARLLRDQFTPLLDQWADLRAALEKVDTSDTLIHPLSGWFWPVLCQTSELRLAFYSINCDIDAFGVSRWNDLYGNFPRPGRPFAELHGLHGITHVVGRETDFERYAEETGDRSFVDGSRTPVSHVGAVMVYDIQTQG